MNNQEPLQNKLHPLVELHKDIPDMLSSTINMKEANETIPIYEGKFVLKTKHGEVNVNGKIQFKWFPSLGVEFECSYGDKLKFYSHHDEKVEILICGSKFGECYIVGSKVDFATSKHILEGVIIQQAILGDKTIPVEKIKFVVPNLRQFLGTPIKNPAYKGLSIIKGRLRFENDDYIIIIDACNKFRELDESLTKKGGYVILYIGELSKKKGHIIMTETEDILNCFGCFLTFLNGRRCSPLLRIGLFEDKIIWSNYASYHVDPFKHVYSWPQKVNIAGLSEIWIAFNRIWQDEDDKDFLTSCLHWYVESNSMSGYTEGAIIMAQTGLELIYNWLLIEKKKIIIGKDAENISASNKIRLLLSQLNVSYDVPKPFKNLQSFVDSNQDVADGPDAFVQIRNAIIHSQEEKREKIKKLSFKAKYEALQLGVWYIELSLLYILGFKGSYSNRCSGEIYPLKVEMPVPWSSIKN